MLVGIRYYHHQHTELLDLLVIDILLAVVVPVEVLDLANQQQQHQAD